MSFSIIYTAQTISLKVEIIRSEVDISSGLHSFSIIGLPDKAVEEAKDRISSAIKNSSFNSPRATNNKIIISLSPADIKKEGTIFDLSMALSYLLATKNINFDPSKKLFIGELSLGGEIRKVRGVLPITEKAKKEGFEEIYVPKENESEASLIHGIKVFGVSNLKELADHLDISKKENIEKNKIKPSDENEILYKKDENEIDFSDIKGQVLVKRALKIAASGGHNIALFGPPGTGKTMLAKALVGIMPDLDKEEVFEVTSIHSMAGTLSSDVITKPPFRSPHHTSSHIALVGGGSTPKNGEITLAHRGVLFLDEFTEFEKRGIESLRQPLEEGFVTVSRAKGTIKFPASFVLVVAYNPCPCGNLGSKDKECVCRQSDLMKYERKLSGPIVDRIDIWITVPQINHELLLKENTTKNESVEIKKEVEKARKIQLERFKERPKTKTNSQMSARDIIFFSNLSEEAEKTLNEGAKKLALSGRAYHKVVKLSRTIADLENKEKIETSHILEALQYRPKTKSA